MPLKLGFQFINTPFKDPFTISGGRTKTHQPSLIVSLSLGRFTGLGEAPIISYYDVTRERMTAVIEEKKSAIEKFSLTEPERYWHYLHHLLPHDPFLVAALDIACWDLFGKIQQRPLYQLWNTEWHDSLPETHYTIGLDKPDTMLAKMKNTPWPKYKIKVEKESDLDTLALLREQTNAPFLVDANGGWSLSQATEWMPRLKKLGVEFIEQPLHKSNFNDMKRLYEMSSIPIFADESCVFEKDIQNCIGCFHGINIKLTKCSGITPALRMIKTARSLNLQVMLGSMNETSVGSAAMAHLIPQADVVDVDGPILLQEDVADGLLYENGQVLLSNLPGLGVWLKQSVVLN